jgi:hypothetical protein
MPILHAYQIEDIPEDLTTVIYFKYASITPIDV